jgi:hypothetical protein
MPRLSVDIERRIPGARVSVSNLQGTQSRVKLLVRREESVVKIEVTTVLRGSVYPAAQLELTERASQIFGFARVPVLSVEDLYAGKMCAALDRQHPRDLYDAYWLLCYDGIDERLKNAFLVYLMSHNRPMSELLAPKPQNIERLYQAELEGMTFNPVELDQLQATLPRLVHEIHAAMTDADRHFLLAFKRGASEWRDFVLPEAERLPAIQWKRLNLARMAPIKRRQAIDKLEKILFTSPS